jgi:hypothetical protein
MKRISRWLSAAAAGAIGLALPAVASAQEATRSLERPEDSNQVVIVTVLAVVALFLVASVGRLYQIRRSLHWTFQDPDDGDHH